MVKEPGHKSTSREIRKEKIGFLEVYVQKSLEFWASRTLLSLLSSTGP
jgi:hypothetical protein